MVDLWETVWNTSHGIPGARELKLLCTSVCSPHKPSTPLQPAKAPQALSGARSGMPSAWYTGVVSGKRIWAGR